MVTVSMLIFISCLKLKHLHQFQVIWVHLFSEKNVPDRGTLYQLEVPSNCSSIPKDSIVNMKVREDFLLVVSHALLRIAAEVVMSKN